MKLKINRQKNSSKAAERAKANDAAPGVAGKVGGVQEIVVDVDDKHKRLFLPGRADKPVVLEEDEFVEEVDGQLFVTNMERVAKGSSPRRVGKFFRMPPRVVQDTPEKKKSREMLQKVKRLRRESARQIADAQAEKKKQARAELNAQKKARIEKMRSNG